MLGATGQHRFSLIRSLSFTWIPTVSIENFDILSIDYRSTSQLYPDKEVARFGTRGKNCPSSIICRDRADLVPCSLSSPCMTYPGQCASVDARIDFTPRFCGFIITRNHPDIAFLHRTDRGESSVKSKLCTTRSRLQRERGTQGGGVGVSKV